MDFFGGLCAVNGPPRRLGVGNVHQSDGFGGPWCQISRKATSPQQGSEYMKKHTANGYVVLVFFAF